MNKLEICSGDPHGITEAIRGGADRIELCSGLSEGGLTPSAALIKYASALIPTNVLIRPRAGDFVYSDDELQIMAEDIRIAKESGATGIVIGALTPSGEVDKEACRFLLANAGGLDTTFHRAFDVVKDPFAALEDIISLGFKRILTSGQARTALEGTKQIAEIKRRAKGRILIMAGAGVNPENAARIITESEADELHASARSLVGSSMKQFGDAKMGTADAEDGSRLSTDAKIVSKIKSAIS